MNEGRGDLATRTAELLQLTLAGQEEACERLFAEHGDALERRARAHPMRRALRTRPDPRDLAHDALLRALASGFLKRFEDRGRGSLRKALFRILDRSIVDAIRRENAEKRNPNALARESDELSGSAPAPPDAMPDRREPTPTSEARVREWIDRCQALLPEREWCIWSEVELRGLSAAEVARSLDISESAARGVLFRARERILHTLCGDDE